MDKNRPEEIDGNVGSHLFPRRDHERGASAPAVDSEEALRQASDEPQLEDFEDEHEPPAPSHLKGAARAWGALWRHPVRLTLAIFLAGLLAVGGLHLWNYLQSYEWTDDAEIDGHLDPISTRINGTIIRVHVEDTHEVKKGEVLVDLDPRDYQAAVESAAANLAEARQAVNAAEQNYQLRVANLRAAIAANAKAQSDVDRHRVLVKQQVVARETYDEIVKIGRVDAAAVDSDRAAVAAAGHIVGQAQAAELAAKAALDQANLRLGYTHVVAPADGVIGDKTVQVGQRVQPGQQLLTAVPLDDVWITADFRKTQLRKIRAGQPVTVHVDTTGRNYHGYVEGMPGATGELYSLPPPENATGNYVKVVQRWPVRIRLFPGQDPDHLLRPGMSVEPTVWIKVTRSNFNQWVRAALVTRSAAGETGQ